MKLYATITSERATKGQGGKTISFKLQDANRNVAVVGEFYTDKVGQVVGEIIDYTMPETPTFQIGLHNKGEKQKGECEHCGQKQDKNNNFYCQSCGKPMIARI